MTWKVAKNFSYGNVHLKANEDAEQYNLQEGQLTYLVGIGVIAYVEDPVSEATQPDLIGKATQSRPVSESTQPKLSKTTRRVGKKPTSGVKK